LEESVELDSVSAIVDVVGDATGENSDSRARCLPGSQACSRKAVAMCEAKLPPSDMATAPSAAAADDVRGPARGEDGGKNIKICWIWTEVVRDRAREEERVHLVDLLTPHPARSSQGGVVVWPRACCRWDLRGLGLLPTSDRICAAYSVRRSRPQQRVVDEVAFPIPADGRTSLDRLGACNAATRGARSRRHRRSLTVAILIRDGGTEGELVAEGAPSCARAAEGSASWVKRRRGRRARRNRRLLPHDLEIIERKKSIA
jgi:hypothetical protein